MDLFSMITPHQVYCGEGAINKITDIVKDKYKRVTLFTAEAILKSGIVDEPARLLSEAGAWVNLLGNVPDESNDEQAEALMQQYFKNQSDLIVAIGGGSVMDIAKLASIMEAGGASVNDLLKNPEKGRKHTKTLLIPTTAGTGSEATMNSIIAVPKEDTKIGIVNACMMPDYVILDGNMLRTLPKSVAAATGADALCHAIECFTSKKANPFSDLFAMEAIKLIFENIEEACQNPSATKEKNNMLLAAFYGGAAIACSGTTAVHALSYPLGGKYHIAHGVANAMLLLPVMKYNASSCKEEFERIYDAAAKRMNEAAENKEMLAEKAYRLTKQEKADWVLSKIEHIVTSLSLDKKLSDFGIREEEIPELVSAGMDIKRLLDNNKREVTEKDAEKIYREIM